MHHLIATLATLGIRLRDRLDTDEREAGYSTVELVVIVGVLIALAVGVLAIIQAFVNSKAALIH